MLPEPTMESQSGYEAITVYTPNGAFYVSWADGVSQRVMGFNWADMVDQVVREWQCWIVAME